MSPYSSRKSASPLSSVNESFIGSTTIQALHHLPVEVGMGDPGLGADELSILHGFPSDPLAARRSNLRLDVLVTGQLPSLRQTRGDKNLDAVADGKDELAAVGELANEPEQCRI